MKIKPPISPNLLVKIESDYSFHNSVILQQPRYKTVMYDYNSIIFQGAQLFNRLSEVFTVDDFNDFLCKLEDYDFKYEFGTAFIVV